MDRTRDDDEFLPEMVLDDEEDMNISPALRALMAKLVSQPLLIVHNY